MFKTNDENHFTGFYENVTFEKTTGKIEKTNLMNYQLDTIFYWNVTHVKKIQTLILYEKVFRNKIKKIKK